MKTFTAEEIAKAPVNTKAVNSLADLGDIDSPPLTESAKARYGQLSPRDAALSIFCLAGMNEAVNGDGSGSRDNKNYETTVAALSLVQIADRYRISTDDAATLLDYATAPVDMTTGGLNPRFVGPSACVNRGFWFKNPETVGQPYYDARRPEDYLSAIRLKADLYDTS